MICLEDGYRRADRLLWQRVSVRETGTEAEGGGIILLTVTY